ncbi:MAG TPA: site-2 protease family protein [Actinomycetota bacterium]|nr:site-2 protease family protein [Actinomycetota bacterium]
MTFAFAIVLFYAGLLLIVIPVHELGHFLVARRFGFRIEEYFVGFGPKLWSTRRGEIEYGVKALPVGGYVKITGMDPFKAVSPADLPRAYGSKPRWQRALVILAGPLSHFLIAFVLFSVWVAIVGNPYSAGTPTVTNVVQTLNGEPSPAFLAEMQPGDEIVRVGTIANPTNRQMVAYTTAHVGEPVELIVRRGTGTIPLTVTPVLAEGGGGEKIGRLGISLVEKPDPVGAGGAVVNGGRLVGTSVIDSFVNIGQVFGPHGVGTVFRTLFLGQDRTTDSPQSVVGIGRSVGQSAEQGGLENVLFLLGFVTVFVGLLNLLPLPPFDGGHLAVLLVERIRGRTIDMRKLIPVSAAVMTFLILFVGATVLLDLTNPIPAAP